MEQAGFQIQLIPAHRDGLGDAQSVPIHDGQQCLITAAMASRAGGGHHPRHFCRRQIFAAASSAVRLPAGRDFPIYGDWGLTAAAW